MQQSKDAEEAEVDPKAKRTAMKRNEWVGVGGHVSRRLFLFFLLRIGCLAKWVKKKTPKKTTVF